MGYIPIPPPIRKPNPTMKMTKEQREYLNELHQWLAAYIEGKEFQLPNGIVRDREFFLELVDKVRIIEGYDKVDREWLTTITKEHNRWKRNG
jgi:hypothetical protein